MSRDKHILVVDDEPHIRMMFLAALEGPGRLVMPAPNGQAALDHLAQEKYDVVLLDLQMPGLGGMDVLEALRSRGDDVPVIVVTAHGSVPDAVKAMRLGAVDFLPKPVTPEQIRTAVDEVVARHEPAAPVTTGSAFADDLVRAKRAINQRAFEEALVFLKQALSLNPDSAEAHNLYGVALECGGRPNEAKREYKAALKADRHYAPAANNLRRHSMWTNYDEVDVPIDVGAD